MTGMLSLVVAALLWMPATHAVAGDETVARLFVRVNDARAERGLTPLRRSAVLDEAARENTRRMARERRLRHSPATRLRRLGAARVAENVGMAADVETLHRLLMASRPHRANLLGPYDSLGVFAERGRDGLIYATFVFAARVRD